MVAESVSRFELLLPTSDLRLPTSDLRLPTSVRIPISKLQYRLACCVDPSAIIARADKIRKKQASHSVSKCGKSQYLEMIQRHLRDLIG